MAGEWVLPREMDGLAPGLRMRRFDNGIGSSPRTVAVKSSHIWLVRFDLERQRLHIGQKLRGFAHISIPWLVLCSERIRAGADSGFNSKPQLAPCSLKIIMLPNIEIELAIVEV